MTDPLIRPRQFKFKLLTSGPIKMNMLLNFPRCLSILLLQTSKTDKNALDIEAIYNLKLRKT
jgi:hypothetical protein